jgi:uncharacterized Zn finger protein
MAYLRDIRPGKCQRCHAARATVELVNRYNAPIGQYCQKCGTFLRKRLEEQELLAARIVAGVKS